MDVGKDELLAYMQSARLAVISTLAQDGALRSPLVGHGANGLHQLVFDILFEHAQAQESAA